MHTKNVTIVPNFTADHVLTQNKINGLRRDNGEQNGGSNAVDKQWPLEKRVERKKWQRPSF